MHTNAKQAVQLARTNTRVLRLETDARIKKAKNIKSLWTRWKIQAIVIWTTVASKHYPESALN
ncbi:MAG: hypothetical protein AAF991_05455 [Pseudomonadota bacterium]